MIDCTAITFAYNQRPDLLQRSVDSAIDMGARQVVLVDDGSDVPIENTWGDPVELIRHPENMGIPAAYATALERVRCQWVVRNMSDDEQRRRKLLDIPAYYDFDAALPPAIYHDYTKGEAREQVRLSGDLSRIETDNVFYGGATLIRADLLKAIGPHPEHLQLMQDWWLHLRIHWAVGWVHVPLVLSHQGVYEHGMHKRLDTQQAAKERRWVRRQVRELGGKCWTGEETREDLANARADQAPSDMREVIERLRERK